MVVTRKNWRWKELSKQYQKLLQMAKDFELYNKTEGKSTKTVRWYNQSLLQFYRFLLASEKSTKLAALSESDVRELILYLQEKTRWQDNPYMVKKEGKSLLSASKHIFMRSELSSTGSINKDILVKTDLPI